MRGIVFFVVRKHQTSRKEAAVQNNKLLRNVVTHVFVWAPWLGLGCGIWMLWNRWVDTVSLTLFGAFFLLSGLGVTVGFHRLFTHGSFKTFAPIRYFFAVCGMLSIEMSLFDWVAHHREHHNHSDKEGDPHSPHHHGHGWWGMVKGFLHAHMFWFFKESIPNLDRQIPDLKKDKGLVMANKLFPLWIVVSLLLPAFISFYIVGTWQSLLSGFVWGSLIRIWFVYHLTWSVNSICHIWGARTFNTDDDSTNNILFGFFALGEGWHNNHHAGPWWARHGLSWWQVDISWYLIWIMERLHLAWDVRRPKEGEIERVKARLAGKIPEPS